MANSLVKGENCILEFYDGGVWKTFACGRSVTFDVITEVIEKTVSESGKFKHIVPTVNSFTLTFDGIVALGDSNFLNLYNLRQLQINHVLVRTRFTRTAMDGVSIYRDEVFFYIKRSQDIGSFDIPVNDAHCFKIEESLEDVLDEVVGLMKIFFFPQRSLTYDT